MHKDPPRRYGSVDALRRDVDHYRRCEPLDARGDGMRYRAGKFVRRNAARLSIVAAVALVMLSLVIFYTLRLAAARNAAVAEAARVERIQRFMLNLFDGGEKEAGPADDLRVVTMLDRGMAEAGALERDPLVGAELYQTLGGIYRKLGKFDRAEILLQSSLAARRSAPDSNTEDVVKSLVALAGLRSDQARFDDAERLAAEALNTARAQIAQKNAVVGSAVGALGDILEERGNYTKAIPLLEDALRLHSGPTADQSDLASTMRELADTQFYTGHYDVSESLNQRVLALHRQLHVIGIH